MTRWLKSDFWASPRDLSTVVLDLTTDDQEVPAYGVVGTGTFSGELYTYGETVEVLRLLGSDWAILHCDQRWKEVGR